MAHVIKNKKQQPLVRMDFADKAVLDQLTARTGESAPRLLHRAVLALKKEIFFQQLDEGYGDLRENAAAWTQETAERSLFENASKDGLEAENLDFKA